MNPVPSAEGLRTVFGLPALRHALGAHAWQGWAGANGSAGLPASSDLADFADLRTALRSTGGLANTDDLSRLLADGPDRLNGVELDELIDAGAVMVLAWQRRRWAPMFQFDLGTLRCRPMLRRIRAAVGESGGSGEAWPLTVWFARPHAGLAGRRPAEALAADPSAVLRVARTDHGRWA